MTCKFLSVYILLVIFVEIIVSQQSSLSPYLNWLKTLDGVLQVPPQPELDSFQFSTGISVATTNGSDQCNPSDERVEGCYNVTCLHEPTKPLEYYRVLLNDTQINSNRSTLSVSFPVNSSEDIYTLIVPFIHSVSSRQTNWGTRLSISFEKSGSEVHYVGFSSNGSSINVSGNLQEVADYQISQSQQLNNSSYQLAAEFTENQLLIFVDGLLWRRYEITDEPSYTVTVTFSDDSGGYGPDIKLYNTLATTGELYSLSYGVDIPERLVRPDCECPRPYMDTYSLMKKSRTNETVPETLCYGALDGSVPRYTNQYQGIWAIFTADGWVSDFTDAVLIQITMPQTMFMYGVTGKFMWKANGGEADTIQRPGDMILSLPGMSIYVYTNCVSEFGHGPNVTIEENGHFQKCVSWDRVIVSRGISNGYQYVTWEMQILSDTQETDRFDDMFAGDDVLLQLNQHYSNSTVGTQGWYHVSDLSIFTRPHCGGSEYQLLNPPPNNIAEYTNFFSNGTKAYHCLCPEMMEDDRCENCSTSAQPFRYKTQDSLCQDCECTDLSLSKSCDHSTGQCPCRPLNDSVLSEGNLRCEWRVTAMFPDYGPVDGKTNILFKGDYLTWPEVNITTALFDGNTVKAEKRGSELAILSPEVDNPGKVEVILQPFTSLNVGAVTSSAEFEYKPNPYLVDVNPRNTILSGGITLTAVGNYMDAAVEPLAHVFLTEQLLNGSTREHQFTTVCSVIDTTSVECPVPDMSETVQPQETTDYQTKSPLTNLEVTAIEMEFDGYDYNVYSVSKFYIPQPNVYPDPIIDQLNSVLIYTSENDSILLEGEMLDWGVAIQNYNVEIGGWGVCDVRELTSDTLLCTPPSTTPDVRQVTDYVCERDWPSPYIKVSVGNIETKVGYIYYKDYVNSDDALNCTVFSNTTTSTFNETAEIDGLYTSTTFASSETARRNGFYTGMALLGLVLALVVIGVAIYLFMRGRQNLKTSDVEQTAVIALMQRQELSPSLKSRLERCKIPKESLSIGQQIGEGHFGLVFKGQLLTLSGCVRTVAVKCLKDDEDMSFEDLEIFLSEGTLMIDFKHKNVMSLLGVIYEVGERPFVVLPYLEQGDLHTFIGLDDLDLVLGDILHFAYQISNGMAYLASKQFVHRDLACRNCMLSDLNIVKIADFGMSKDIDEKKYYRMASMNKPLPIRWMAVESMKYGIFTVKSDVWSFGVTLWELLTRGILPFTGITNQQVKEHIINGSRLFQPDSCPPVIYEMMLKCWDEDPENRPEFTGISAMIKGLFTGEITPKPGSGADGGYYYNRNLTSEVPDNYFNVVEDSDDDYIIVLDDTEETLVYTIP